MTGKKRHLADSDGFIKRYLSVHGVLPLIRICDGKQLLGWLDIEHEFYPIATSVPDH